jgi:hypothetical protein
MQSDDDKRELQARHRELANQLNGTTPASGQVSGSWAATPPSRQREDSDTSIRTDEQQPRPSRSSIPKAAAPAGTPSTTTEPSISDEPATGTPDSSAAASDTRLPSRSAIELTESAATVAGSQLEPSRDSEHPPSDRPRKHGDTAAAVSSGSAQPPPTSRAPSSTSADRAADTHSDSRYERHANSSLPSSARDAQPTTQPAQSQSTANPDSSASSTPARRARPAPQSQPSSTSNSAVEAGDTALAAKDKPADKPKDKTARERGRTSVPTATPDPAQARASGAADTSADRVYDQKAATVTTDSSGQHSRTTSRSTDQEPSSPGSTARPATQDHPPTAASATTAGNHRGGRGQR